MTIMHKLLLFNLLLISILSTTFAYADYEDMEVRFITKHGELIFVNEKGEPDVSAVDIKLNGKVILSSRNRSDGDGYPQSLMLPDMVIPYQYTPKSRPTDRPLSIDRIIVEEGPRGGCGRKYIILDFTLDKPYVSERFGDNPNDDFCFTLNKIQWGREETYIYISGPEKYLYYTGGRVVGPLDE